MASFKAHGSKLLKGLERCGIIPDNCTEVNIRLSVDSAVEITATYNAPDNLADYELGKEILIHTRNAAHET